MITLSQEWMMLSKMMYGQEYIDSLGQFLRSQNVHSILECGCGSGHVLYGLAKLGFRGLGIDNNNEMIAKAIESCPHPNLQFLKMDWLNLSRLNGCFDAVICRGNSLTYVATWDKPQEMPRTEKLLRKIRKSIRLMFSKVKLGGLLYVDTISQEEIDKKGGNVEFHTPNIDLRGKIIHDWRKRLRITKGDGTIDGQKFYGKAVSYLIRPKELEEIIRDDQPARIWSPHIQGENNYHIICAIK